MITIVISSIRTSMGNPAFQFIKQKSIDDVRATIVVISRACQRSRAASARSSAKDWGSCHNASRQLDIVLKNFDKWQETARSTRCLSIKQISTLLGREYITNTIAHLRACLSGFGHAEFAPTGHCQIREKWERKMISTDFTNSRHSSAERLKWENSRFPQKSSMSLAQRAGQRVSKRDLLTCANQTQKKEVKGTPWNWPHFDIWNPTCQDERRSKRFLRYTADHMLSSSADTLKGKSSPSGSPKRTGHCHANRSSP